MFWISFVIFIVTTVVYVLWASGEVQPWNNPNEYYAARDGAKLEAAHQAPQSVSADISAGTEKPLKN